jgi:hypothetical protein
MITKLHYECVDCGSKYWKYNHAVECCNKCAKLFRCTTCNKEHYTEGQANDCCSELKVTASTSKDDDEDIK